MRTTSLFLIAAAAVLPAAASAESATKQATGHAIAVLQSPDGKVTGTLHFTGDGTSVRVHGSISGLAAGRHGFHVHEFGDCSAADYTSAGGHFNPTKEPHAAPADAKRHVGDLGNIEAAADGTAAVDVKDTRLAFEGPRSIVGRAVIVHAKADDLKTQPTGDAGGRVACGVVGIAKPEGGAAHKH